MAREVHHPKPVVCSKQVTKQEGLMGPKAQGPKIKQERAAVLFNGLVQYDLGGPPAQ